MDSIAVHEAFLRTNKAASRTKYEIDCSLYTALNKSTTTISDIVRWQWEIADIAYKGYNCLNMPIYSIDPHKVFVDTKGNIVFSSVFKSGKGLLPCSDLMAANNIISIHSNIICGIGTDTNISKRELQIFQILADHILDNSSINISKNMVAAAFFAVDNFCQLIELGLLDSLGKIE